MKICEELLLASSIKKWAIDVETIKSAGVDDAAGAVLDG